MPGDLASHAVLVSLNTRGIAPVGSRLAARYAVIGAALDAGDADVACFQEVVTWWHLRLLARQMRSFRHVSLRRSAVGPAGGLATFSRLPVSGTAYHSFGDPPAAPGISRAARLEAKLKGVLVTRLAYPGLCVINAHPAASRDGDWSPAGRRYPLHRAQLAALAQVARSAATPAVVCGDLNVDRDSPLFREFAAQARLADAFGGNCPATFRAEYLPPGTTPTCIDFILTSEGVRAEAATVMFAGQEALPRGLGYVSDHLGLRASVIVAPPSAASP